MAWLSHPLFFSCEKGANSLRQDVILLSARARMIDRWMAGWDGWYDLERRRVLVDCISSMVTSNQTEIDRTSVSLLKVTLIV